MNLLLCALAAALLQHVPGVKYMETVVQDDAIFLHRPWPELVAAARQIRSLGATRLRITAGWSVIAPDPQARRRPGAPFDASDPSTYRTEGFRRLDHAVEAAAQAGLKVELDVAFWAPRWAVARGVANPDRQRYRPDAAEFGRFAAAVARRYSGAFTNPYHPRRKLPAVRMYVPWNEPNYPTFLLPQWKRTATGQWRPESPHVYRDMYQAAYDAIKRVSPADQVLLGNTSSMGSPHPGRGGVPPMTFLRTLACVDDSLRPLDVPECAGFRPLRADGYAHHPYSRFTTPATPAENPDDAPLADTPRLAQLLRALEQRGRIVGHLPVYDTEYGYETRPPDPYQLFTPTQQAVYMGWSDFLAWHDPSTLMFAQFQLRDLAPGQGGGHSRWRDFQSGLFYADGTPKPGAQAFAMPFWAQRVREAGAPIVLLFGQVRPGAGRRIVRFERLDPETGAWRTVTTTMLACGPRRQVLTDPAGFVYTATLYGGPGTYRMVWLHDQAEQYSVPVSVDEAQPLFDPAAWETSGFDEGG